ncbi:hypothetical protein KI387_008827 [Taxus chinensis]|uniref:MBD domain-containing protein n=1 Tax=Taxus chinensis TaxID=29808 RepID=A0AA38CTF8_TAXCH|nr:hypothetical protein KI387_008827 [Taxus chinensis]
MESKELVIVKEEQICPEMLLPVQTIPPEFDLAELLGRRNRALGEIIQNPDWLPSGWITEIRTRKSGLSAGQTDKYYFQPGNGGRFRSKAEVMRYLQTGSKDKPKSISNAQESLNHTTSSFITDISNAQTQLHPITDNLIAGIPNAQAQTQHTASAFFESMSNAPTLPEHTGRSFNASLSNVQTHSDPPACGCSKPVYYYRPVVCESPLYAEHPGLYPVVYFPVIGNCEDRFKHPPANFFQNLGDLKPIFSQPSNAPPPYSSQYDFFRESLGPHKGDSRINAGHEISENVPGESTTKNKKPTLACGLAASNPGDFRRPSSSHQVPQPRQNSYPISNPIAPNSLALSCNISKFTVTTPAGVFSAHLQYRPSSVMEQQHYKPPITSQIQTQSIPKRAMRGQLSPEQLSLFNQSQINSTCTALVPWKA